VGEMRRAYKILFGKPKRKRALGRRGSGLEDITRMDLKEIE
jgi:hypothetical protein